MSSQQSFKYANKDSKVLSRRYALELTFRITLLIAFIIVESASPYMRVIQPEELWQYRFPLPKTSFLEKTGGSLLYILLSPHVMILYTFGAIFLNWNLSGHPSSEYLEALLVPTLSIPMTGVFVNVIKIGIGRPRPTFMARCYGPQYFLKYTDVSQPCTGEKWLVADGRKSFPSGHSSLAFACFVFLFLYMAGQLGTFNETKRRRYTAHLMLIPLILSPIVVALSRVSDYKHHWEDVVVGGIIGTLISYLSYRIYFPSLCDDLSHLSYSMINSAADIKLRLSNVTTQG